MLKKIIDEYMITMFGDRKSTEYRTAITAALAAISLSPGPYSDALFITALTEIATMTEGDRNAEGYIMAIGYALSVPPMGFGLIDLAEPPKRAKDLLPRVIEAARDLVDHIGQQMTTAPVS